MEIFKLVNPLTGKSVKLLIDSDTLTEDITIMFGALGGGVLTREIVCSEDLRKTTLANTDLITVGSVNVDGVSSVGSISFNDLKTLLKTYFDGVYSGGTNTGGTTTEPVTGTSTAPIISGSNIGNETQTITLTIDNYDPTSIYTFDVSGGSFSRSLGVITWVLPQVSDSTAHKLTVTVTNPGKTPTQVFHPVNVFNINTTVDSMVLYEGSTVSEFTTLHNIEIIDSKLVATDDTPLTIVNNKILAIPTMEAGDKILVDNTIFEVRDIREDPDGANNVSLVNMVSAATSDITPEGTVIYDSQTIAAGYLAFDRNDSAGWRTNKKTGLWIGFKFNTVKIVNKYRIAGVTVAASVAPKAWKFQASNDGTTWIDLSSESDQINWYNNELRVFSCVNSTPYLYYRVYITEGNGSADLGLASLELIEALNSVSETMPVLPQFITNAKLLTKYAESNIITQDSYETDFTGVSSLTAVYEQFNLMSLFATITSVPTKFVNIGDVAIFGNTIDGVKTILVDSSNFVGDVLDITSLGFTVIPTYGYRKDSTLQVSIGTKPFAGTNRVDTILTAPLYDVIDGGKNTSIANKVPVLSASVAALTGSTTYEGFEKYKAFDGMSAGSTNHTHFSVSNPNIVYDFTTPVIINKYGVKGMTGLAGGWVCPVSWTLSGSNDNTNWTLLHTQTKIVWPSTETTKFGTFGNNIGFRYYKWQCTDNGFNISLPELILVEAQLSAKVQIKAVYGDIITGNSARTLKFRIKLNKLGDGVSKLSADIQKL